MVGGILGRSAVRRGGDQVGRTQTDFLTEGLQVHSVKIVPALQK